jgi:hypothetical protein
LFKAGKEKMINQNEKLVHIYLNIGREENKMRKRNRLKLISISALGPKALLDMFF